MIAMALVKVLAKDWTLETADLVEPTQDTWEYTAVCGFAQFSFDSSKTDTDTTDFCGDGYMEHIVAQRGYTFSADIQYYVDTTTKERDAGQQVIQDRSDLVGPDANGWFRLTDPSGFERWFQGSVNQSGLGGSTNDSTTYSIEITINGAVLYAEPPTPN